MSWSWPFRRGSGSDRGVPWIPPDEGDEHGLVGVGGDLSPETLVRAYSDGVFPWFNEGDPVLWWSPDPRAIIELDGLHVPRRLARTIRSGKFRVTVNRCFEAVMRACGDERPEGTWVTEQMVEGYTELHRRGHAHSLEVWGVAATPPPPLDLGHLPTSWEQVAADMDRAAFNGWELAGGIYGVAVGGMFAGESMFHRQTDASKVALVALVDRLRQRGYVLFDVQMTTEHTARLGAIDIPREVYLERLAQAVKMKDVDFT